MDELVTVHRVDSTRAESMHSVAAYARLAGGGGFCSSNPFVFFVLGLIMVQESAPASDARFCCLHLNRTERQGVRANFHPSTGVEAEIKGKQFYDASVISPIVGVRLKGCDITFRASNTMSLICSFFMWCVKHWM